MECHSLDRTMLAMGCGQRGRCDLAPGRPSSWGFVLVNADTSRHAALRSNGGLLYDVLDPAVGGGDVEGSD